MGDSTLSALRTVGFAEVAETGKSPRMGSSGPIIYGLRLDGSPEYRYVGQTSRGLGRRMYLHRWESNKERPRLPVHKWIRSHQGKDIVVDTLIEFNEDDVEGLNTAEIDAIAALRESGHRLLNVSDGGGGTRGYRGTADSRRLHSERMTGPGNPRYGTTWTPELRQKIMERLPYQSGENSPNWGREFSEEHRRKLAESHHDVSGQNNPFFGQKHSDATRAAMRAAHQSRTPEQKAAVELKRLASLAARSDEANRHTAEKRSQSARARGPENQRRLTERAAAVAAERSPEERRRIVDKATATRSAYTHEERAENTRRRQQGWADRTPEQRQQSLDKRRATLLAKRQKEKDSQL